MAYTTIIYKIHNEHNDYSTTISEDKDRRGLVELKQVGDDNNDVLACLSLSIDEARHLMKALEKFLEGK